MTLRGGQLELILLMSRRIGTKDRAGVWRLAVADGTEADRIAGKGVLIHRVSLGGLKRAELAPEGTELCPTGVEPGR